MTVDEWVNLYREALPARLRPRKGDDRVYLAAVDAHANGWAPRQMAALIAREDYSGTTNPVVIGILRLEQWATEPPATTAGPRRHGPHPNGCIVCPPWAPCEDPVRTANRIPAEWVRERFQLLYEFTRTPEMTPDECEESMRWLIEAQRARVT